LFQIRLLIFTGKCQKDTWQQQRGQVRTARGTGRGTGCEGATNSAGRAPTAGCHGSHSALERRSSYLLTGREEPRLSGRKEMDFLKPTGRIKLRFLSPGLVLS